MTDGEPPRSTRDAIWASAVELFARDGYAGTSVRDISGAAGVDAAMVIRHFGSKEALFLDTMRLHLPQAVFDGELGTLGRRHIRELLSTDQHAKGVFLALLRASDAGDVNVRLREMHEQSFVGPIMARLTGSDAELRARLAAALVGGLMYSMWVVGDESLLAADPEVVVDRYGALLQRLFTPE